MKRILIILLLFVSIISSAQIVADHTIIDEFESIPQQYIDSVKKMWLVYAGESHSGAIRGSMGGMWLLEQSLAAFDCNITTSGTPEAYTTSHLRVSRGTWGDVDDATGWIYDYGEEDWFTSPTAIARTKAGITYCNANDLTIGVIGFGWCYDSGVSYDDYISATKEYIAYCADSIATHVIFTTGTVDASTEEAQYLRSLGWQKIRDTVALHEDYILFDYADILCYDSDSETPNTATWDGHTFPIVTTANLTPTEDYHISQTGAVRLAKAMWWMLARIAGWDGVATDIGGDYYVATDGDDGAAGTFAAPWATLQHAIDVIEAGDTVYVRGGTYNCTTTINWNPSLSIGHDGSAGNIIAIFNYPGETPVFDFINMHPTGDDLYNTAFFVVNVDYATIRGLEIKNITQRPTPNGSGLYDLCYGVRSQYGNHLRFERMRIHDVAGNCMRNSLAHYVEVINCDSWNACDTLHATLPGNWGAGFAAGNTEFTDGYLYHYGCRAWECSDNAFVGSGNRSRVVYDHCWTFDNGAYEGEGIGWKLGYWTSEQLVDTLMTVKNCIAANCLYDGITGNEGTTAGSNGYVGYYHLYNNFVYNSGRNGIKFRNTAETDAEEQKRKDYNNLTYANEQDFDDYLGEHTGSNNSYDSEVTVTAADFISLDITQLYGERQADGSLPDITFGTLAGTSDLINAGTYVGIDTIGAGADIGWKEYGTPEGEEPPAGEAPNVIIFKPYPVVLRSATVSGNCNDDGGGTVTARGLCWATTEIPDLTDNVITSGSGTGSFSVTITGLNPGTTYYARSYATNEAGTSYSSQYTFTTPKYQQVSSGSQTIYSSDGKVIVIQ